MLLARSLAALPNAATTRPILLAVSGGPDSMALLVLAAENRETLRAAGFSPFVATVDHGLRAASAAEAEFVREIASSFGLPHACLGWRDPKPATNIPAQARVARYRLLCEHADRIGAAAIVTAHHEDDQIETYHLAVARGAGDRGRAGMRRCRTLMPGLRLLRPFLDVAGARLKATVAARGLPVLDDPSNRDLRFDRARLRRDLRLDPAGRRVCLAAIACHAAARDEEEAALARLLGGLSSQGALAVDEAGAVRLRMDALSGADARSLHLLLERIIQAAGGAEHPPAHAFVARLAARLRTGGARGATLGGVALDGREIVTFVREYGRSGLPSLGLEGACAAIFDRRMKVFECDGRSFPQGSRLVAFGALGAGNPVEKVLPVLLDETGGILAIHLALRRKRPQAGILGVADLIRPRILADLPGLDAD